MDTVVNLIIYVPIPFYYNNTLLSLDIFVFRSLNDSKSLKKKQQQQQLVVP